MFFDVMEAHYIDNYRIRLRFEDGSIGIADLSDYPNEKNVFRTFLDMNYFRDLRIEYGTIIWGNGELDIAPERLYTIATGSDARQIQFYQESSSLRRRGTTNEHHLGRLRYTPFIADKQILLR